MRRLGRILLNALTVLSLLLCVGTVALWVRSYQSPETYEWIRIREDAARYTVAKAVIGRGGIAWHVRDVRVDPWRWFSGQRVGEFPEQDDFDTKGDEELRHGVHRLDKPWPTYPLLSEDHRAKGHGARTDAPQANAANATGKPRGRRANPTGHSEHLGHRRQRVERSASRRSGRGQGRAGGAGGAGGAPAPPPGPHLPTIDRELGWAESLGFNSVRVFLHDLAWRQDHDGFLARMDQLLAAADRHHVGVDFVLFDSVWDPNPKAGKQREPKRGLHNSGWVQSPGREMLEHPDRWDAELKPYVQSVVGRFKDDRRVHFWETINEPDNANGSSYGKDEPRDKVKLATDLLERAFAWARDADPSQPVTSGVWIGNWGDESKLSNTEKVQLGESDVISFHSYAKLDELKQCIEHLRRYHRPILCTEYMARPRGSTFDPILGYLKTEKVAAYNWGFVAGKTNTIYAWDTWQTPAASEPKVWFHDIFRPDGTPFDPKEVQYIRSVTGK